MGKIITCEQVFRGHPDKVCDQISDSVLDLCLSIDKNSRVAIETAIKNNDVYIIGELTTKAVVDFEKIARKVLKRIGYTEKFNYHINVTKQSPDIALGVDKDGAGDQGMMYGYATDETPERMPYPFVVASKISASLLKAFNDHPHIFGPDGKCEVACEYDKSGKPVKVKTVVVSAQTRKGLFAVAKNYIVSAVKEHVSNFNEINLLINPTGAFEVGGPYADSGLTGRKIICDTYGGVAHHGGGAFSGKDPSKVDRSGAYYCRFVAKTLVDAGFCKRCEVGVAYSIGVAEPVSISVDSFGTGIVSDEELSKIVKENFDFKPASIKHELKLLYTKYQDTAYFGHFGRKDLNLPWEDTNAKAQEISKAYAKAK